MSLNAWIALGFTAWLALLLVCICLAAADRGGESR